ncbi:MAG: DUF1579 family protein [Gemmatimonadales bacterium]
MKTLSLARVPMLVLAVSTFAVAQAPQPGPEVKKYEAWIGTWKYEGDAKATPIGPASKVSGTQTGKMVLGGFALEWKGEEKGQFGAIQWSESDVYDAAAKTYPFFGVQNDGATWTGVTTITGNVWKSTGQIVVKGTSYKTRTENTPSADGKKWTWKSEMSTDGKTWVPWSAGTITKTM